MAWPIGKCGYRGSGAELCGADEFALEPFAAIGALVALVLGACKEEEAPALGVCACTGRAAPAVDNIVHIDGGWDIGFEAVIDGFEECDIAFVVFDHFLDGLAISLGSQLP